MGSKPRIYTAITTFHPLIGGAETQTLTQSQQLRARGYSVQIVTFHHKHSWPTYEEIQGVPVLRVGKLFLGKRETMPRLLQRLMYFFAICAMCWTLWRQRNQFDVLQVCQFSPLVLPLAFICLLARKAMTIVLISAGAGKASKTKTPATLIAGPLDPGTPWLKVDGHTWVDGDLYGLQAAGEPVVRLTRFLLKRTQAVIIVLSTRMLRYLKENQFDLPGTQMIPNGVDMRRFQHMPLEPGDINRARTVVCVSNLRYEKGIDVLLHAWRHVQEKVPEAQLVIVGSGALRFQLQKMAQALEIESSIEFAGLQSDVPAQLQRGSIMVLPSRWEGMPNALLEAMACGSACVATRVSGSEDLIQHESNGLLVPVADPERMAEALITLLQDPDRARQYGEAAHQTILQHYTIESVIQMYTDIYHHITSHGAKERL